MDRIGLVGLGTAIPCVCIRSDHCLAYTSRGCRDYVLLTPEEYASLETRLTDAKFAAERIRDLTEETDDCPDCCGRAEVCEKHGDLLTEAWGQLNKALEAKSDG